MEPYRITTEDGKKVVEMIRAFLAEEAQPEEFQAKLDDFRERLRDKLTDEELSYAADVSLDLDLYEQNPDLCSADPLLLNEERLRQSLKEYLGLAVIEDV